MRDIAAAAKKYMSNNAIAADAANRILFHVEQKIQPEELVDLDPFGLLKYSKDKQRIAQLLKEDTEFRHLDRDAADVLRRTTSFRIPMEEEQEEQINMCKAIDDMMRDAWEEKCRRTHWKSHWK